MLNNSTIERLHDMKLSVMASSFKKQLSDRDFAGLSFEERFGLLADSEWIARKNNSLNLLIRKADYLFPDAALEDMLIDAATESAKLFNKHSLKQSLKNNVAYIFKNIQI